MSSTNTPGQKQESGAVDQQQAQQVGESILHQQELYAAGRYAEVVNFHLYDDCYHIRDKNPRPTSINAIKFHDLELCDECRTRFFAIITTRKRGAAPRNSRKIHLRPSEIDILDAFISAGVLKDRATTIRTSLYELKQTQPPIRRFVDRPEKRHENGGIDHSDKEQIYADIHQEDVEIVRELVESDDDEFTTSNQVYRTAVILYLNTLSELDLETYLGGINVESKGESVEKVTAFDGFQDIHGDKPLGSIQRLKQIVEKAALESDQGAD